MQKERRSKKRAELHSPPAPPCKSKIQKRKVIIHELEEEEEEQEGHPLKRRPREIPWPQLSSAPSSADPHDQVLQTEPNESAAANLILIW